MKLTMTNMCKLLRNLALLSVFILLATGCSDDDVSYGTITLSQKSVYLTEAGSQTSFTFSTYNIASISVSSMPDGWTVGISMSAKTIYVTAPDDVSSDTPYELEGTVSLSGVTPSDGTTSASFTVGIAETIDISEDISNSMFVSTPDKIYSFDATQTTPGGASISPSSACVIWQSTPNALAYANLDDNGNIVFYINTDSDDDDEDGDTDELVEGNALIGALDSSGDILWSWHIWVSKEPYYDAAAPVVINGKTIMNRNLGAFTNSNATTDDILTSYGLYYQWGRKEPFAYPAYYNGAGGTCNSMTGSDGYSVLLSFVESDSDVGTLEYALENPLEFILGVEESNYDWVYSAHNSELWSSTKSIYDPCPKGWRVADADVYDGLTIEALADTTSLDLDDYSLAYGWELTDGSTTELFMGFGRRNYLTGTYQNVYPADDYLPWVGNYWTLGASTTESDWSLSLYFTFDASDQDNNYVSTQVSAQRANAMQLRCQKIE